MLEIVGQLPGVGARGSAVSLQAGSPPAKACRTVGNHEKAFVCLGVLTGKRSNYTLTSSLQDMVYF